MAESTVRGSHRPDARFDARLADLGDWSGELKQVFTSAAVARPDQRALPGLTLLSEHRDLVPFGVRVPWQSWSPTPGDRLRIRAGKLELWRQGDVVQSLSLDGPSQSLTMVGEGPVAWDVFRRQLNAVAWPGRCRRLLSLRPAFDGSLAERECCHLARALDRLVNGWWLAGRSGDLEDALAALVGFGSGSTPSGDDLLIGCLAAGFRLSGGGCLPANRLEGMLDQLRLVPTSRTTPLAAEMIAQACQGSFCAALNQLAYLLAAPDGEADWPDACRRLCSLGAQSGEDMLAGFLSLARGVLAKETGVS